MSQLIHASPEKPVMLCKTCGIATSFLHKLHHMQPIKREKRKTWRRIDKLNKNPRTTDKNGVPIEGQQRIVYFSTVFLDCIKRKHKLGVRFKPFPRFLVSELNFKTKGIVA